MGYNNFNIKFINKEVDDYWIWDNLTTNYVKIVIIAFYTRLE